MERTGDWQAVDPLNSPPAGNRTIPSAEEFLHYLAESKLLIQAELNGVLAECPGLDQGPATALVAHLIHRGLLNDFQANRLLAGQSFGLVLGHYRLVDRLGAGGMGVVYKAEHIHMKRVVALKVLALEDDRTSIFLQRFYSEMQALAVLRHPNIVLAFDAGEVDIPYAPAKVLRYLVMEHVIGRDLEQVVLDEGPLPIVRACQYVRQVAEGLRHAHEHGLVHRDIKPSNLLVTAQDQIKILDFGLARLCRRRFTEAHAMLGTVDYMAPEQARDARTVDIRADIYGLGGVLYWLLTGQKPFSADRPPLEALLARQHETPPPLHHLRPEVPLVLEALVVQMMAPDPNNRYPTPLAVITALNAFLDRTSAPTLLTASLADHTRSKSDTSLDWQSPTRVSDPGFQEPLAHRALVVTAQAEYRTLYRGALESLGVECLGASDAAEVLDWLVRNPCDLLLIDTDLPNGEALTLCQSLGQEEPIPHVKWILIASGQSLPPGLADLEVDGVVAGTASSQELLSLLRLVLRLKDTEDRCDALTSHLLLATHQLEETQRQHEHDLELAQDVLIFAMTTMVELRGQETTGHLQRMSKYVRVLAEEAMRLPAFAGRIDQGFIRLLERCVSLHDIGKVNIPDDILLKPGRLDDVERTVLETHTVVGAAFLEAAMRQYGTPLAVLEMGMDVCRHHHEHFDGSGFPNSLAGEAIPLAARLVCLADAYDTLRRKLPFKPSLSDATVRRLILDPSKGQFDPGLLVAFRHCQGSFQQIFEQTPE